MEAGWESRGSTSAFRRTLEVWRFSLGAVFKVLKANKVRAGGRARCVGARVRVLCRRACVCCDVTGACRVSVPCTRRRAVCAGIVAEEGSVGCLPAGALMCARALHSSFAKHFTNQTKPGWILRRLSTRAGGQEALLRRRLGRGAAARGQGGGRVAQDGCGRLRARRLAYARPNFHQARTGEGEGGRRGRGRAKHRHGWMGREAGRGSGAGHESGSGCGGG
jgi:hypothetical protein